jgi:hypothetical protein
LSERLLAGGVYGSANCSANSAITHSDLFTRDWSIACIEHDPAALFKMALGCYGGCANPPRIWTPTWRRANNPTRSKIRKIDGAHGSNKVYAARGQDRTGCGQTNDSAIIESYRHSANTIDELLYLQLQLAWT